MAMPFFGAMQDGANRAATTPEEADDAGREHLSGLTRLIVSIVRNIALPTVIREYILAVLREREFVREVHHEIHHHHETVTQHRLVTWRVNPLGVLLGAVVGAIVSWIAMTQINASTVKLAGVNGTKVVAAAAVDNGWFIFIFCALVIAGFAALGGFLLREEHEEELD